MNQVEMIKEISGVNPLKCMKCGKCSASCPSFNEMDIKPHQFVSYVVNEDVEALVNSKSLWKCLSCFACVERCPRDVKPGKLIDAARQMVIRQKGQDYLSPNEIPELLDEELPQQLLVSAFRRSGGKADAENRRICLSLRKQYCRNSRREKSSRDGSS